MLKPICKSVICHISAFLPITSTKEEQKEYKKGKPFEAQCRKILPFLLLFKKQYIFHLPSPFNARHYLAFVTPERNILLIDIPVSCLQFLQQFTFGHLAVTFQTVCPDIIAQNSGNQRITFQVTEHTAQLA